MAVKQSFTAFILKFTASLLQAVLLVSLAGFIASLLTLESIGQGSPFATPFITTYFRVRDIHVRVTRGNARFADYSTRPFYEHTDETGKDVSTEAKKQCPQIPGSDRIIMPGHDSFIEQVEMANAEKLASKAGQNGENTIEDELNDEVDYPIVHYFDPSYADEYIPPPKKMRTEARYDEDGDEVTEHLYISCAKNQQLFEEIPNFLPEDMFHRISSCLVGHLAIHQNPLADEAFSGTTGFATKFGGTRGMECFMNETMFNCDDFNPLVPYFNAALDPLATGFVMNVLVANKPKNGTQGVTVAKHVDNTLSHDIPNSEYYPRTVSVLYVNVPSDMKGGQLEIVTHEDDEKQRLLGTITPEMNKLGRFKGDQYHQVKGYETESEQKRISLVLEQYRILPQHQSKLTQYETSVKNGLTMM